MYLCSANDNYNYTSCAVCAKPSISNAVYAPVLTKCLHYICIECYGEIIIYACYLNMKNVFIISENAKKQSPPVVNCSVCKVDTIIHEDDYISAISKTTICVNARCVRVRV
jgi:hypothetical protein